MGEEEMGNLTIDEVKTKGQIRRVTEEKRETKQPLEGRNAAAAAAMFSFTRPQEFSSTLVFPPSVPTTSKFTYLSVHPSIYLPAAAVARSLAAELLLGIAFERLGRRRRWSTRRV